MDTLGPLLLRGWYGQLFTGCVVGGNNSTALGQLLGEMLFHAQASLAFPFTLIPMGELPTSILRLVLPNLPTPRLNADGQKVWGCHSKIGQVRPLPCTHHHQFRNCKLSARRLHSTKEVLYLSNRVSKEIKPTFQYSLGFTSQTSSSSFLGKEWTVQEYLGGGVGYYYSQELALTRPPPSPPHPLSHWPPSFTKVAHLNL